MVSKDHGRHIDPHVHCRDWEQAYKATIGSVTKLARSQGIVAFVDMPNTSPPITTGELADRRIGSAREEGCLEGYYLNIGATRDPAQVRQAAGVASTNPRVVGIKMYAGKSTGDLEISDEEGQRSVYSALVEAGYEGVLALHCEDESLFDMSLWDPNRPYTWGIARPPAAEVESLRRQLALALEYNIKAHLHICHISVPEAVELVDSMRGKMRISCGATPHHLSISTEMMQDPKGIVYKVNPPIRSAESVREMRKLLKEGRIDIIETDHAPHSRAEKEFAPGKAAASYMSGIPSMDIYSMFLEGLRADGFTEDEIDRLTYRNVKKIYPKIKE